MKIESIKIDGAVAASVGLKEVNMSKLGQVVLIAGRNGAGKSRLLKLVNSEANMAKEARYEIENIKGSISSYENHNTELVKGIRDFRVQIDTQTNAEQISALNYQIKQYEDGITYNNSALKDFRRRVEYTKNIIISGDGQFFSYVPKDLILKDPNDWNKAQLLQYAISVKDNGLQHFANGALAAIQVVQNRYFNARHPDSQISEEDRREAVESYNRLNSFIEQMLNVGLSRDRDDNATIFGQPLGQANLSNGQIVLLQFCVALHAQATSLPDLILLLDEPENHLHPAALNYVLDRLQTVVTNGQIWIATHSINLLAHFDNPTIYYIEDGTLSYAGDVPEKVLAGLLGNEQERAKLANFLALPFEMSNTKFAYESLLEPAVVMTGANDPQLRQIWTGLKDIKQHQGNVKLLDYGAGRGRLIATMHELGVEGDESLDSWLNYVAYDLFNTNAAECRSNIERVYPTKKDTDDRYYNDITRLRELHHDHSFDMVLLANVFHEIPPAKWLSVLGVNSTGIANLLKEDGVLLIIEDQRLPHGELANEYGFLLFDTLEFRKLFQITSQDQAQQLYVVKAEKDNRLKAHYFKRELLLRATAETRKEALEELQKNASEQIKQIRNSPERDFKRGKLHAFWMTQYANAQLALQDS